MSVVETDYKEYAVLYSCTNSLLPGVFHTEYLWILTRQGVLSNPSRQNIYDKLDKLNINRNQLQLSDRFGCPPVNASLASPAREEPGALQAPALAAPAIASQLSKSLPALSLGKPRPIAVAAQPVAAAAQPIPALSQPVAALAQPVPVSLAEASLKEEITTEGNNLLS